MIAGDGPVGPVAPVAPAPVAILVKVIEVEPMVIGFDVAM